MSSVYNSKEHRKKVANSLERDCAEWKLQKNLVQKAGQQQAKSMPITYTIRQSCFSLENSSWQSGWPKQPNKDMASSLDRGYGSVRPLDTTNQAHDSMSYSVNSLPKVRLHADSPQISSSATDIINTEHGFIIQMDTKYFQPKDIQITLHQQTLTVIGDRLEDDGTGAQRLRRRFTRKYIIPSDVRLSSVTSYATNDGCLIIKGSRKVWKETDLTEHLASSSISSKPKISAV